jgi:hypothetical protein
VRLSGLPSVDQLIHVHARTTARKATVSEKFLFSGALLFGKPHCFFWVVLSVKGAAVVSFKCRKGRMAMGIERQKWRVCMEGAALNV